MQTLVEIGPFNASQGQHRRKDATDQMLNFNNSVDSKRHIIIRTGILYNEVNSGQIMKKTLCIYIYVYECV